MRRLKICSGKFLLVLCHLGRGRERVQNTLSDTPLSADFDVGHVLYCNGLALGSDSAC